MPFALPSGLRLDTRRLASGAGGTADESHWFLSAVLFRQEGLHLRSVPFVRLSYAQMNARTYVLDEDDVPGVYFLGQWVPSWIAPAARLAGGGVVAAARFEVPASPLVLWDGEVASWRVRSFGESGANDSFVVHVRPGAAAEVGAVFPGGQEAAVCYLRDRLRGYTRSLTGRHLRRVDARPEGGQPLPVRVDVEDSGLLSTAAGVPPLGTPHWSFLCPEVRFTLELVTLPESAMPATAAAAV